jgi:hypothetical protein
VGALRRLGGGRAVLLVPYTLAVVALTMVVGYRPPTWPDEVSSTAANSARTAVTAAGSVSGSEATPRPAAAAAPAGSPEATTAPTGAVPSSAPAAAPSQSDNGASAAGGGGPTGAPAGAATGGSYAPTSTTAPAPGSSLDEGDVREVLGLVFDLGRPWSQKAPFIESADALAAPYQQLVAATSAFGAVELRVADVRVEGDQAPFTVDAYLNGALVRAAIPGTAQRVGPAWRLTRASVCDAFAVAAVTCPT